ncbi:hypothetical protein AYI70_g10774 [Smittium culicis]|uniref:Uncharacterized protein n=1 Tax=Smittium culicis TaxID=133412 RepID=A0A1R1X4Z7_9FUNG|nr:hypothetical protein AYI70_g10774 [Smittium culicis]
MMVSSIPGSNKHYNISNADKKYSNKEIAGKRLSWVPKKTAGIPDYFNSKNVDHPSVNSASKNSSHLQPDSGSNFITTGDIKYTTRSLYIILNVIFSSLGVGFAAFYFSPAITTTLGYRVIISLFSIIFIASIESYLFSDAFTSAI